MIKQYFLDFQERFSYQKEDVNCDFEAIRESMKEISSKAGIHEYTGNLVLFICLSKSLEEYYKEAGMSEEVWFTTMCDLKWKLAECKEVYKVCGTFVPA